jgi:hypothetical protein
MKRRIQMLGLHCQLTVGLCDVGGFEILPPGTAAQLKNKCTNNVQKMIEKLLPEPQPNSELMQMGIASAPILQNPMLCVRFYFPMSMLYSFGIVTPLKWFVSP